MAKGSFYNNRGNDRAAMAKTGRKVARKAAAAKQAPTRRTCGGCKGAGTVFIGYGDYDNTPRYGRCGGCNGTGQA